MKQTLLETVRENLGFQRRITKVEEVKLRRGTRVLYNHKYVLYLESDQRDNLHLISAVLLSSNGEWAPEEFWVSNPTRRTIHLDHREGTRISGGRKFNVRIVPKTDLNYGDYMNLLEWGGFFD